ncbi:MAG: class I SAM-dependent methyltransferase [Capsulimonadales bacterium]|nr:class I SAM-dependent methyltransferase [Capsulimonadales bacterium]
MDIRAMHEDNRAAWNEAAAQYAHDMEKEIAFLRSGGKNLMDPELPFLADLATWCHRAIHLQCAGGSDTLSLWNHGAREVIGIDISDRMIETARRKSEALNAPARWFRCDVLETPHELDGTADLVYTGRGALCWNLDLNAWAGVVTRLLKPGGRVYVFEGHPMDWCWDMNASELRFDPQPPYGSYFSEEIGTEQGWPTTYIQEAVVPPKEQQARKHERQWTLGQVLNALADAGLRFARLEEHPVLYWNQFPNLPEDTLRRLPHTFSLLFFKER